MSDQPTARDAALMATDPLRDTYAPMEAVVVAVLAALGIPTGASLPRVRAALWLMEQDAGTVRRTARSAERHGVPFAFAAEVACVLSERALAAAEEGTDA